MKKVLSAIIALLIIFCFVSCGDDSSGGKKNHRTPKDDNDESTAASESTTESINNPNLKTANLGLANEFTRPVKWESDGIEFCMPENYDSGFFNDCGLNCMIQADCYDANVSAYHEYDKESETIKKTVGKYTFDYQSFDYLGLKDWHIIVIRIAFTESRNQMEHRYYKIVYTVYGENYPESQVEKFMATLHFPWFD